MVKIKKEVRTINSTKNKNLFKKGNDKKKLKKLKGLLENENIIKNDVLKKSTSNKIAEKKTLKKIKEQLEIDRLEDSASEKLVSNKLSRKKVDKVKQTNYLNSEISKKFNITQTDINKVIKSLIKFRAENPKLQNQLFEEAAPLSLQISCHKIPRGTPKVCRIHLKHSLYTPDDEICLIVSEVKGIKNINHEKHVEHYEKLLKDKGVKNIKKIMTFHEFRTEYETFEQKHRLVELYDVFLADSKICGKVTKKCGKIFYIKRKIPTAVKLQASKLKEHFDKTLQKTFLNLHLKGNSYTVQFGHTNMQDKELIENLSSVLEFLDKGFPGGYDNIQGLLIMTPRAPSLSIYFSTKSANDVDVPKVVVKKPKAFKNRKGELTTLPDAKVVVKPTGEVIVKKKNKNTIGKKIGDKPGKYVVKIKTKGKQKTKRKIIKKVD